MPVITAKQLPLLAPSASVGQLVFRRRDGVPACNKEIR
jgi:hypothetical protein